MKDQNLFISFGIGPKKIWSFVCPFLGPSAMCQLRAFVTFELFGSTQKVDYRYKAYEKYYHFDHIIVFQLWRLHEWQIYDFWSYNLVLLFLRLGLTAVGADVGAELGA